MLNSLYSLASLWFSQISFVPGVRVSARYKILTILLTGCYQDIDLDKYKEQNGEHLLTINSIINPDSTISVAATRTYFFQDVHNRRDYVKGLDIKSM